MLLACLEYIVPQLLSHPFSLRASFCMQVDGWFALNKKLFLFLTLLSMDVPMWLPVTWLKWSSFTTDSVWIITIKLEKQKMKQKEEEEDATQLHYCTSVSSCSSTTSICVLCSNAICFTSVLITVEPLCWGYLKNVNKSGHERRMHPGSRVHLIIIITLIIIRMKSVSVTR